MSNDQKQSTLEQTRSRFRELVLEIQLVDTDVYVSTKQLTAEEAIGSPERRDFPIIIGKEHVIEATVLGAKGQAYTDSPRAYTGVLGDVLKLPLTTNNNRAIYVATLNAVLNRLNIVTTSVHCRDEDPEKCALDVAKFILDKHGQITVGLIGLNPAIAERLVDTFRKEQVRITDLYVANIGAVRFGVEIWDGFTRTEELVQFADLVLLTGTTLLNNSFDTIMNLVNANQKKHLVYGVTTAGVSHLTDIPRICPYGRTD
ncbi:Rossmann-like domain-containing protein [Calditrichota bacterium]